MLHIIFDSWSTGTIWKKLLPTMSYNQQRMRVLTPAHLRVGGNSHLPTIWKYMNTNLILIVLLFHCATTLPAKPLGMHFGLINGVIFFRQGVWHKASQHSVHPTG